MGTRNQQMKLLAIASLMAVALLTAPGATQTSGAPPRPKIPLGLDLYMPVPEDNPLTAEKVALGRKLFFDKRLSRDKTMSCATCHDPQRAFTDGHAVSVGVFGRKGPRNVPTLINRGYGATHFWDGRASSLEEQVLQPIQNPKELDMTVEKIVKRVKKDSSYARRFQVVFGSAVNGEDLAMALANYVRTILSGNSPLDRYLSGQRNAISPKTRAGLRIFRGKGNCTACHLGPNFSDERFHNTGIAWRNGRLSDSGRFAVTDKEQDLGAFKTPTLREVAQTTPYMHDGSLATLEQVIEFYNRGGNPNSQLDPEVRPLHLTAEEKEALLVFLKSLSGDIREGM